ncbi:PAX-interacting protein 1-like protein [Drosera capensis]
MMGSVGRRQGLRSEGKDAVVEDTERQEFDEFSGESDGEVADAPQFSADTVRHDNTVVVNDASETQLNFDCEAQVMDFDDETLVMDTGCETELVTLGDETQIENLGGETEVCNNDCIQDSDTQLLHEIDGEVVDDSDGEDADLTKVLTDTEGSTATQSSSNAGDRTLGNNEVHSKATCCQVEKACIMEIVPSADAPCISGPVVRGFTHVRTASLRAFGLAAGRVGPKCSNMSKIQSTEEQLVVPSVLCCVEVVGDQHLTKQDCNNVDQQHYTMEDNEKPDIGETRSKCGSKAARKLLFMGVADADEEEQQVNINYADEATELPQFQDASEQAGLSYANSQEPGDLSQANALKVVDKFLEVNVFDFDLGIRHVEAGCKRPNSLSGTKGTQKLAKKADLRRTVAESRIFDWDDNLEDEGGGEFFCKKKDVLGAGPGSRKSSAVGRKPRSHSLKGKKPLTKSRYVEENGRNKVMSLVQPGSKSVLRNLSKAVSPKKTGAERVLDDPVDELKNVDACSQLEVATPGANVPAMLDVGINTQMAAETLELLAHGDNSGAACRTPDQGFRNRESVTGKQATKSAVSKQGIQKRVCPSGSRVILGLKCTKSNLNVSDGLKSPVGVRTRSKTVRKRPDIDTQNVKSKNRKLSSVGISKKFGREMPDKLEPNGQHTRTEGFLEPKTDDQRYLPEKNNHLPEKVCTFSPAAWRTRRSSHSETTGVSCKQKKLEVDHGYEAGKSKEMNNMLTASSDVTKLDGLVSGEHLEPVSGRDKDGMTAHLSEGKRDLLRNSITTRERSKRIAKKPVQSGRDLSAGRSAAAQPVVSSRKTDLLSSLSPARPAVCSPAEVSPGDVQKTNMAAFSTPNNGRTPINTASPVLQGNDYYKKSCKKIPTRSYLVKELSSLTPAGPSCANTLQDSRKRRDMSCVRVFFSRHLDEDVTNQQKKILVRLGASLASSILDATHFVTDKFVRTRNMLEAIARGKPVVTDSWLESCGQASCLIDEKNYILRDARKEKEIGFSMPLTLARASQYPLLKDKRVFITPSAKPGVEIISSLVRAVQGRALEKISRSLLRDDKLPDDLLVLSCDDDYELCLPLMEKGASVYSSELLLNGIVTQKLEYESIVDINDKLRCEISCASSKAVSFWKESRHRLFADNVKRTRSTIWVKRDGEQFLPVTRRT